MCLVLVVDDHECSRRAILGFLEEEGHSFAEASNGQEALDWLRTQTEPPCVVLVDLRMPVMDGWDFLRVVGTVPRWRGMAVIVVSGTIEREAPQPVLPAMAFWSKPIEADKIRNLHRYCHRHRNARAREEHGS